MFVFVFAHKDFPGEASPTHTLENLKTILEGTSLTGTEIGQSRHREVHPLTKVLEP